MSNWKLRSQIYHAMFPYPGDDLSKEVIIEEKDKIVERALEYPTTQTTELYYPGKSYAVAIAFALLLVKNFGGSFLEYLDDAELLAGNDPYFVTYMQDKETYDEIFKTYPFELVLFPEDASANYQKTIQYFYKEMLLAEDTKQYAPAD